MKESNEEEKSINADSPFQESMLKDSHEHFHRHSTCEIRIAAMTIQAKYVCFNQNRYNILDTNFQSP